MSTRRTALVCLLLGACAGADCRLDPSPSCSYRTERAEVRDAGSRERIRAEPSLGQRHGCVRYDEDDALCWGDNDLGQISERVVVEAGAGYEFDEWRGGDVMPVIAAGGAHTCAIAGGDVYCWGNNDAGQLGQGDTEPPDGLKRVPEAEGATSLSSGLLHTCAVTPDGVLCWGDNRRGQLGNDDPSCCQPPTLVEGLPPFAHQVVAGGYHSCVYALDETMSPSVWCWGDDRFGALGDGEAGGSEPTPAPIVNPLEPRPLGLRSFAAGAHHTCLHTGPDGILCWGRGTSGELGDGRATDSAVPVFVELPAGGGPMSAGGEVPLSRNASGELVAGEGTGHTCARTADLRIWCWGDNGSGQLGRGDVGEMSPVPVQVVGEQSWNHVGTGGGFTCGVTTDGELWCWGRNDGGRLGRLGAGSFEPRPTSVVP